jgi:hypothetical protein
LLDVGVSFVDLVEDGSVFVSELGHSSPSFTINW